VSEKLGENRLLQLKVVREIGYFGEIDVMWQILPRDITVDDVSTFSGSIIFQQSQKEAFIEIFVIDDDLPEPIEVNNQKFITFNIVIDNCLFKSLHVVFCCQILKWKICKVELASAVL